LSDPERNWCMKVSQKKKEIYFYETLEDLWSIKPAVT
jgi:hypothetical protein